MAECMGNLDDHCCWLGPYGVCSFLRDDGLDADRRWVCTLREQLGSWSAVHDSDAYRTQVRPKLVEINIDVDCGDWPRPRERCATCGVIGDG